MTDEPDADQPQVTISTEPSPDMGRIHMCCDNCHQMHPGMQWIAIPEGGQIHGLTWTCPHCGHDNSPSGTYEGTVVDGEVRAVLHDMTPDQLRDLRTTLTLAMQNPNATVDDVADQVGRQSSALADWLRQQDNRNEVWAILGVLLAIVSIVLTIAMSSGGEATPAQINQTVVNVESGNYHQLPIPRRSPCFCGSEKRFKNCHGKEPSAAEIQRHKGVTTNP